MNPLRDQKGAALTIAVIFGTLIALIAGFVLSLSYNQTKQIQAVGPQRTTNYYKAQAGFVDATWRIRVNKPLAFTGWTSDFKDATFDPPPYYIDIETNTFSGTDTAASDVKVDIGPVNASGMRPIDSTGLDK